MKCLICKKELKVGDELINFRHGFLTKDEFDGIGFEGNQDLGLAHFKCIDKLIKGDKDGFK